MTTRLVLIHAMSPLHAGTGQSVGAIDLPIARERPTGIPLVPGSSIKGALRARCDDERVRRDVFGPDVTASSEHAGSVQFSDAHLVFLPVRSVAGTFAWVTSPYLLQRFARDAREAGIAPKALPAAPAQDGCTVLGAKLTLPLGGGSKVVLEDLDFAATAQGSSGAVWEIADQVAAILFPGEESERTFFRDRVCLVHDDVMALLLDTATEVAARIRLDNDTKTVAKGGLWYEEALPCESVLAGLAVASDVKAANGRSARTAVELLGSVAGLARGGLVQLGGKSTVGRGSCHVRLAGGAS